MPWKSWISKKPLVNLYRVRNRIHCRCLKFTDWVNQKQAVHNYLLLTWAGKTARICITVNKCVGSIVFVAFSWYFGGLQLSRLSFNVAPNILMCTLMSECGHIWPGPLPNAIWVVGSQMRPQCLLGMFRAVLRAVCLWSHLSGQQVWTGPLIGHSIMSRMTVHYGWTWARINFFGPFCGSILFIFLWHSPWHSHPFSGLALFKNIRC